MQRSLYQKRIADSTFWQDPDVITSLYIPDVVTPDVNQYKPSKKFDFCLISPKNMEKPPQNIFIINFDLRWDTRGLHFFEKP